MIKVTNKKKMILAASIAGLMAVAATPLFATNANAADGHCYGVNKCKGAGACGGKDNSCGGQNACAGQGWLDINADTCMKIEGGRLSEEA